ncbi:MFS transporter [Saccharopolyspora cebuensis]
MEKRQSGCGMRLDEPVRYSSSSRGIVADDGRWWAPLGHSRFRCYFAGHVLSTAGDSLVPLTIAFAALSLSGSAADVGWVLAANRVPIALLVLLGGALGDRWDRRRVMVCADVLRCAAQAATGLVLLSGQASVLLLVMLQAVAGVGTALFSPAATGLVPALVPHAQLRQANALLGIAGNTNKITSISLAGVLVAVTGPGVALLLDAATFAASTVALLRLRLPASARHPQVRVGLWRQVRDGAHYVITTRWLAVVLGYGALLQALVIGPHMVAGPLLSEQSYGGPAGWATIGVVQAVGSLAGGALALRVRPRRPLRAGLAISLLMVPYLLLFACGAPLWLVAATAFGVGIQGAFFLATQATVLQTHIPDHALSRVAAWAQLGNLVLLPTALAAAGPIAAAVGGQTVLLVGAGWLTVSTLVVLTIPAVTNLGNVAASPADRTGEAATSQRAAV